MPASSALDLCLDALAPDSLVLVAVSGGADSVFLLRLLAKELPARGHRLAGVHVNHGQRHTASDADAAFVEELVRDAGLDVYTESPDLEPEADEDTLRQARLSLLKARAAALGAHAIAFGHTEDDAAETFLLMALRGSGPRGLGSMGPVRELPDGLLFLRPVLDRSREEIRGALRSEGHLWREDAANADQRFRRNVLRREVLPPLERLEPAVLRQLALSAAHCRVQDALVARLADQVAAAAVLHECRGTVLFDVSGMEEMPEPLAAELFRSMLRVYTALSGTGGEKPFIPPRTMLGSIAVHLSSPPADAVHYGLPQGVFVWIWRSLVMLHAMGTSVEQGLLGSRDVMRFIVHEGREADLVPDEEHAIGGGTLHARTVEGPPGPMLPYLARPEAGCEWFDRAALGERLVLRHALAEDRVTLSGGGSKPLFELLRERGVPPPLRPFTGLVASEAGIVWVPEIWRSPAGYLGRETREMLHLEWIGPRPPT